MVSVSTKAKEWDCSPSTVRNYCASGIIPPASKTGMPPKWLIPDGWPKPPMGRHGLCFLLDTAYQLKHDVAFDSIAWGYKEAKVREGYNYLVPAAFLSTIDTNNLKTELKNADVTPRGLDLIERESRDGKSTAKFKGYVSLRGSVGIASFEAGGELRND